MAMALKETLHDLIDRLPDEELVAAERYLRYLQEVGDPFIRALHRAPMDDEEEADDERSAVQEGYDDLEAGRVVPLDDVRRDLEL